MHYTDQNHSNDIHDVILKMLFIWTFYSSKNPEKYISGFSKNIK